VKKVFVSDCEGPISKNDNAFELAAQYVPNGNKLFTIISRYDDVLADVVKRSGYKAGNTLKLILPFLKAYDVTDIKMQEFSARNLILISHAKEMLHYMRRIACVYIVSTSYEHYVRLLCQTLGFPFENTYCTRLCIDKYHIPETEKTELKRIAFEIAQIPMLEIPSDARSLMDLSRDGQKAVHQLDGIFEKQILAMEAGKMLCDVDPIGGSKKAQAIGDVAQKNHVKLEGIMYVGDSITDEEAFKLVKENGGLTVSFNGNQYAVKNAEIAVQSESSLVTAVIADVFCRFGRQQTLKLVENWSREELKKSSVNSVLLNQFLRLCPSKLPKVKIVTSENVENLAKESSNFRKRVRGEVVGRLG
jgi:energy-converting hydrogenase A subunit R